MRSNPLATCLAGLLIVCIALPSRAQPSHRDNRAPGPGPAAPRSTAVLDSNPSGFPAALLDLGWPGPTGDVVADAWHWLDDLAPLLGLQEAAAELELTHLRTTGDETVLRFGQHVGGIPVFRGEVLVVIDAEGRLEDVINGYVAHDRSIDELAGQPPAIDAGQALRSARRDGDGLFAELGDESAEAVSRLIYVAPLGTRPRLAWEVHPPGLHLALNPRFFYDAQTGELLSAFNDLWFENQANVYQPSPGSDGNPETVPAELRDRDDPNGRLTGPLVTARNCIDDGQTQIAIGNFTLDICSEIQVAQADENGDFLYEPDTLAPEDLFAEAHMYYHVAEVYSFFRSLGFDELDEVPLPATVNFRIPDVFSGNLDELVPFDNAFFYPAGDVLGLIDRPFDSIIFGQGTQVDFSYDGDVIYHEFGHAVLDTLITPGQFAFDEYGLTSAPGAINEGQADYFAAAFTEDPEIGEYVGPRIVEGTSPARNIRTLDSPASCPTAISGELHLDSVHFSAALWDLRTAYVDELEGEPAAFDAAVLRGLGHLTPFVTFQQAAALIEDELAELDTHLVDTASPIWTAHGIVGCDRWITLGGLLQREDLSLLYGPQSIGLSPGVPGFMQFRVVVDPGTDPPANTIALTFAYSAGGFAGFGGEARPEFLVSYGGPVRIEVRGTEVSGDWLAQIPTQADGSERRVGRYQVEGGLAPGEYFFLPLGTSGSQGALSDIAANVRFEEIAEEPEPEPTDDMGPDTDGEVDALLPDVVDDLSGGGQPGSASAEDGCGCSATPSRTSGLFWAALLAGFGILLTRRRLNQSAE